MRRRRKLSSLGNTWPFGLPYVGPLLVISSSSSSSMPATAAGYTRPDHTPTRRTMAPTRQPTGIMIMLRTEMWTISLGLDPTLTTPLLGTQQEDPTGGFQRPWWRTLISAVASFFQKCFGFLGSCFKVGQGPGVVQHCGLQGFWSFLASGFGGGAVYDFNDWLEKDANSRPHPRFFEGTFSQVLPPQLSLPAGRIWRI